MHRLAGHGLAVRDAAQLGSSNSGGIAFGPVCLKAHQQQLGLLWICVVTNRQGRTIEVDLAGRDRFEHGS